MARRTVSIDSNSELLALGIPPWEDAGEPLTGYVGSRFDDSGPLAPLLWIDLRRAYGRNGIQRRVAVMFEMHMAGMSFRRIAEVFGLSGPSTVKYWCERVRTTLENDSELGIMTTIVEECGGWRVVAEYLFT